MIQVPSLTPAEALPELMHRLRNPLAALRAGVSLLQHTLTLDGEASRLLDEMAREVGRLDAMTRETQRFYHLSAGRPERIHVAEAAREAWAALGCSVSGAAMEVEFVGDAEEEVIVDRDHLLFSLGELMANANRQAPGSRLRVSWRRTGANRLAVDVSDSGPGIPAAHVGEIGTPYFTTSQERTGLGLATVAKVCQLAGGALRWSNLPGGGCRFMMELPIG